MAGGVFAQTVACPTCAKRSERTVEGDREDQYRCEAGHPFQILWGPNGAPTTPEWPLSPEQRVMVKRMRAIGIQ